MVFNSVGSLLKNIPETGRYTVITAPAHEMAIVEALECEKGVTGDNRGYVVSNVYGSGSWLKKDNIVLVM